MPDETVVAPTMSAKGEVCGCPCKHAGSINLRTGFILCLVGGEKLCSECVAEGGPPFECHAEHTE